MIVFKNMIPIKPISINQCWQGRRFMTPEYKQWRESVLTELKKYAIAIEGKNPLRLEINLYLKSLFVSDIDNFLKPLIDCIVKSGIITDDRYITELNVKKIKSEREGFAIYITDEI